MTESTPTLRSRRSRRLIIAGSLGLIIFLGAFLGPGAWSAYRLQRNWEEAHTVVPPADHAFVGEMGTLGPLIGWVEADRWNGTKTGRELWWYKDSGTLARARFSNGITDFYQPDGTQFAQSRLRQVEVAGFSLSRSSIFYSVRPPWTETPTPSDSSEAPWIRQGVTATEWWNDVRPQ